MKVLSSFALRQPGSGHYELLYEDDGPGLNAAVDFDKADSLGLKLIRQLAEQLDGTIQYSRDSKSRFILAFKDFEARNRD